MEVLFSSWRAVVPVLNGARMAELAVEHPGAVTLALRCSGVSGQITHPLCLQTHILCDLPK